MRPRNLIYLSAAACLMFFIILCVFMGIIFYRVSQPEVVTWDLSHGDTLEAVHWPTTLSGEMFERKGKFDLTIIGGGFVPERNGYQMRENPHPEPEGKGEVIFHEEVQHFFCYRKGNTLDSAAIFFGGYDLTAEQAYTKIKNLMTVWQFRPKNFDDLEKWHSGIAAHTPSGTFITEHQSDPQFDYFIYPAFEAIKAGNVRVRVSVFGGKPEDGSCRCGLTLTF